MTAPGEVAARDRVQNAAQAARQAWPQTRHVAGAVALLITAFALTWGAGWVVAEIPLHKGYSDLVRVGWAVFTVGLYAFMLVLVGPSIWRHEPLGRPDTSDSRLATFTVGVRAVVTVWIAGFAAFVLVTVLLVQYDKVRLATAGTPIRPPETLGYPRRGRGLGGGARAAPRRRAGRSAWPGNGARRRR